MTPTRRSPPAGEANPLLVVLAEVAVAVVERRRETAARRRTITVVEPTQQGMRAR